MALHPPLIVCIQGETPCGITSSSDCIQGETPYGIASSSTDGTDFEVRAKTLTTGTASAGKRVDTECALDPESALTRKVYWHRKFTDKEGA